MQMTDGAKSRDGDSALRDVNSKEGAIDIVCTQVLGLFYPLPPCAHIARILALYYHKLSVTMENCVPE